MKPLLVDLETEWRGGQSQFLLTLRGLRERGHAAELVAPRDSALAERASELGVPVHITDRFLMRLQAALVLRRLLREGRFDLLHANEPHALTAAWIAGVHSRLPILLSRRIGFPLQRNWISRARFRAVQRFVANCNPVAQSLAESGIALQRIVIVKEGIEIPSLPSGEERRRSRVRWGIREGEFVFGCVGVFVPEKGQRHLVEALAEVRKEYPRTRLLLAGDGPCRKDLERLASRLGQTEAVLFPGFVEDVTSLYAALDAFLFPSEFEGLGTSLQAAMAWGLPAASTARGGLAEVVDAERTALVVEPTGAEFAGAMLRLLEDPRLRETLGFAARKEASQGFSAAHMVGLTAQVYEEVCRERKTA